MSFSMENVQKGAVSKPRKVIIYGPPKLGKSTLAASAINSLMIPTEDRVSHIACDKAPVIQNYSEITDIFDFLLKDKKHGYKRVIIDSLDWTEPLLHKHICEKKGYSSLTDDHHKDTAFQKGLKYVAVEGWKGFLHNLDVMRDSGFDVIVVAHSHNITIHPPDSDPYDKSVMKIDKNALAVVEEWADVIAFYDKEVFVTRDEKSLQKKGKAVTTNKRILHLSGINPSMLNGNSFGLPDAEVVLEHCSDIMEWLLTENMNIKIKPTKKEGK